MEPGVAPVRPSYMCRFVRQRAGGGDPDDDVGVVEDYRILDGVHRDPTGAGELHSSHT
jgi:hypothetical protein